ncbi:unnamed protein product [Symbiodinium sp. CCMP2592]|nr:unnamed protein product [Symbiodinium sp. CCMP2592]
MVGNQEGSSEGPMSHLECDVKKALVQNQALHDLLVQSVARLSWQQSLIFCLQVQFFHRFSRRDADQELECCKAKSPAAETCAAEELVAAEGGPSTTAGPAESKKDTSDRGTDTEDNFDDDWIFVCDDSEEPVATEGGPLTPAALWLQPPICHQNSQASGDEASDESPAAEAVEGAPPSAAALWLQLPICVDQRDVSGHASQEPSPQEGRQDAACQTHGEESAATEGGPQTAAALWLRLPSCQDQPNRPVRGATTSSHCPFALAGTEVGGGECTPSDLHVPNLLPFLTVLDLMNWRLLSRRTRSPQALVEHIAEMGSMDRTTSVVAFGDMLRVLPCNPHTSFAEAFGGDAEQRKFYECRCWCKALASKTKPHFAEGHVRRIVAKNLQSLLWHCRSENAAVASAGMTVLLNYAADGLPFVQQPIAATLLSLLEDIIVESDIVANMKRISQCIEGLQMVLRSMERPQRRRWVSLMVHLLSDSRVRRDRLLLPLNMLWVADDDPRTTYKESRRELKILAHSVSTDSQSEKADIMCLIHSS